ncbi:MAG TPA: type II secretion system F family protein [Campylobacterales bacterium]|nr:type II secretion system F family protein [Campylobacterales bacterium]HIO70399.1 type II secretion system F family protein [Campylobacterales bacterium]
MIFKYKGVDREGKKVSGRIEASDLEEAKRRLKSKGIFYEKVVESSQSIWARIEKLRATDIATKKLAHLSRNLSIYLKASIPILQAVKLAKSQSDDGKMLDFLTSIETMLDEGNSFYYALENQTSFKLPDFYKQSIKIGEENGVLGDVLGEMANFLISQDRIVKQISQAMIYPTFIILISIAMVSIMLTVVVPKITSIFVQMKQEIPPLTQFVIDTGNFLGAYWLYIAIVILVVAIIFSIAMKTVYSFKYSIHYLLLRVPFLGKVIQTSELTRFSYVASVLLKSGVTFVHTIRLAGQTLDNVVLKEKILNASKLVVEGKRFSTALLNDRRFKIDKSFIQAIALGEETSEVSAILDNLASLYQEENGDAINIFLSMLEPALILIVGVTIGVIVTAMLLPIFSINLQGM